MFRMIVVLIVGFAIVVVVVPETRAAGFDLVPGFPKAAEGAFGVKAEALADGRFIVWNGNAVYLQEFVGGDGFSEIASGYVGDPAFVAVAPDGHSVVLGAGYSGNLYRFDPRAPQDYQPGTEVAAPSHYYGVYLSDRLVLLDRATDDFSTSELVIVDIGAPTPGPRSIMLKPANADLTGAQYGVSACLAVDAARTNVYAMGLVYDGFNLVSGQLKRIPVSALIDAYNSKAVLDWNTDAVAIGAPNAFNSGGPAGVATDGDLLIGGFGGVQRVDPVSVTVVATYAPAGAFDYYGVAYNSHTDVVLPMVADPTDFSMDVVYAPQGAFAPLPVTSGTGLALLLCSLIVTGMRKVMNV